MPIWVLVAAALAAAGYFAIKKEAPVASPSDRFAQGKVDGGKAALEDISAKKPNRLKVTAEDIDLMVKNPSVWMSDPEKAYAIGFNVGYNQSYTIASSKTMQLNIKKDEKKKEEIPSSAPSNWPASCKWPPKSVSEYKEILKKIDEQASGPMGGIAQPSWWPSNWGWPPICPPDNWPKDKKFPPTKKEYNEWVAANTTIKPSSMTLARRGFSPIESLRLDIRPKCDLDKVDLVFMTKDDASIVCGISDKDVLDEITSFIYRLNNEAYSRLNSGTLTSSDLINEPDYDWNNYSNKILFNYGLSGPIYDAIARFVDNVKNGRTTIVITSTVTSGNRNKIAKEWRSSVPSWYFHPSMKKMQ